MDETAQLEEISSIPTPVAAPTPTPDDDESEFQDWYASVAAKNKLDPNPDDPRHQYDFRGFWEKNIKDKPEMQDYHGEPQADHAGQYRFSDEFKTSDYDQASHDSPEAMEAYSKSKTSGALKDFEIDLFQVLDSASDYDSAITEAIELRKNLQVGDEESLAANKLLADYADKVYHAAKKKPLQSEEELFTIAPIKPSEVAGNSNLERIDNWEKANLEYLDTTDDLDLVASRGYLEREIIAKASEAKRSILGGHSSWVEDKFFRVAGGAISPVAEAFGFDEADKYLTERTNPKYDEDITSILATGLGAVAPVVAGTAVAGPVGAAAVIGTQMVGEGRAAYNRSMEATGDPERAMTSAVVTGGAMLPAMVPMARVVQKTGTALAAKFGAAAAVKSGEKKAALTLLEELQAMKPGLGSVGMSAAEGAIGGATSTVVANVGTNIGLDQDGELTHGAVKNAIAFSIMGGGFGAVRTGVERLAIKQLEETFKKAETEKELAKEPSAEEKPKLKTPEEKKVNDLFVKDEDGHLVPKEEEGTTVESRAKDAEEYTQYKEEYQNKIDPEDPTKLRDEAGIEFKYGNVQNEEVSFTQFTGIQSTTIKEDLTSWGEGHQVFDVYHGTPKSGFETFSEDKLGTNTGAASAKLGFFGAADPKVAESYTRDETLFTGKYGTKEEKADEVTSYIYEHPKTTEALRESVESYKELIGYVKDLKDRIKVDKESLKTTKKFSEEQIKQEYGTEVTKNKVIKNLEKVIEDTNTELTNASTVLADVKANFSPKHITRRKNYPGIHPLKLKTKNPKIIDAEKVDVRKIGLPKVIKEAKEQGYDAVILKNFKDPVKGDVFVWFDPAQVKSKLEFESVGKLSKKESATAAPRILVAESKIQPNRYAVYIAKALGATFELRSLLANGGVLGQHDPKTGKVSVLRNLGTDPEALGNTIAHEISHFFMKFVKEMPTFASDVLREQMTGHVTFASVIKKLSKKKDLYELGKKVSKDWRGDWTAKHAKYRDTASEVWADIGSARIAAPEWLAREHPELNAVLEAAIANEPVLGKLFKGIDDFNRDPYAESKFNFQIKQQVFKKHGDLNAAAELHKIKANGLGATLKRHLDLAYEAIFNKTAAAKRVYSKLSPANKLEGMMLLDLLSRKDYGMHATSVIDKGVTRVYSKFSQTGIPRMFWPMYEQAQKIVKETTRTIENVKSNPETYTKALEVLRDLYAKIPKVKATGMHEYLDPARIRNTEDLVRAFSQLGLIGDLTPIITREDFMVGVDPADPVAVKKANWEYVRAVGALQNRKESVPYTILKKLVATKLRDKTIPAEVKAALMDVLTPNAFAVRRFLVNENGATIFDAERDLAYIRHELDALGPTKYAELEKISKEFHKEINIGLDVVRQSEILTPEMFERFELNKDVYVTNAVLKYFTGDENIDGSIRSAIGSFDEVGNPLTSTPNKMKAVLLRAYYQRGVNSAVRIAKLGGSNVIEVAKGRPGLDIFSKRDKLSKGDPDNSYLVSYENGKPVLYKLEGKSWENMFKSVNDLPGVGVLLHFTDTFNKLFHTRQFKTIFSPAFIIGQKFYDRKLEAILANSFAPSFGLPVHLFGKLRPIDKQSKAEVEHFRKTGELTGRLKELVDLDGVILDQATLADQGMLTYGKSIYDVIHEEFGSAQVKKTTKLDDFGVWSERKLNKIFLTKFMKNMAEFDEIRTKVNGYRIGKEMFNMSDAEAAVFARENFGVPDPLGGGFAAPLINRMFLFGRAHLNGLRVLGNYLKRDPKMASMQIAYRVLLPKMLMMPAVMQPVLREVAGEEAAESYRILVGMVPEIEKITNNGILLGGQDGKGKFHNFFEISPKDIQSDWKAWYVRIPQSRELTSITKALWPFFSHLFQGQPIAATQLGIRGAASNFAGNVQPGVQYAINMFQMAAGYNPTDFFRRKDIFDRDTMTGGGVLKKTGKYAQYWASSQFPAVMPYNPWRTEEPVSTGERVIQNYPLVGPLARRLTGVSNYGLYEQGKEAQEKQAAIDAQIKGTTGDATQKLLKLYSKAQAEISTAGKDWPKKAGPDRARQIRLLTSWHANVWQNVKQLLRAAREKENGEDYDHWIAKLEKSSSQTLLKFQGLASSLDKMNEKND